MSLAGMWSIHPTVVKTFHFKPNGGKGKNNMSPPGLTAPECY